MKRTPLKRRTPMRKVSARRRVANADYTQRRKAFLAQHPFCQVCIRARSQDIHHKAGRLGGNLLNEETWCACCRVCHDEIHRRPAAARAKGLLI